jgi:hypothetical protein
MTDMPATPVVLRGGSPSTQYSEKFLQGMVDRGLMSFSKYGHIKDSVEKGMDPVSEVRARLRKYWSTGNTEWLIDAANYCMIEFMHPSHPEAHFRSTDSSESDGRAMRDGTRHAKHADQMGGDM